MILSSGLNKNKQKIDVLSYKFSVLLSRLVGVNEAYDRIINSNYNTDSELSSIKLNNKVENSEPKLIRKPNSIIALEDINAKPYLDSLKDENDNIFKKILVSSVDEELINELKDKIKTKKSINKATK